MKSKQNGNSQRNDMIKSKQTRAWDSKSNLYNAFILKRVSITNISIEHYIEGVLK